MQFGPLLARFFGSSKGSRTNQVSRAIESTKRRQTPVVQQIRSTQQQRLGRSEYLDVDKLNKLIRTIDKTWILPRPGSKEPVGSNFQYKKTCASIYKVRHGACQQIGFGVMCFNYCHEQGQKLAFRCQDTSDASYCRNGGTFDTSLAKYRKDSYKAKAFIHQMISRCYATAICNLQTGLLNSTLVEEGHEPAPIGPSVSNKATNLKSSTSALKHSTPLKSKPRVLPQTKVSTEAGRATTKPSKTNIWDRFTVNQKAKPTAKYIPFWQKLLVTSTTTPTTTTTHEVVTDVPEEKVEDIEEEEEVEEGEEETETTTESFTDDLDEKSKTEAANETGFPSALAKKSNVGRPRLTKPTWKPLETTESPASLIVLDKKNMQKPKNEKGPGFWNRFQPGKWFQSIHYVTNTGR
ncbi:unnamed protein product [Enterobius vermicularis]|uniref:WSC domain-containing protein n=1 Tax=Enterobius vermicularis TaxID=51028 RepID=A0A0N4VD56_ENTVE|nr:unnamed protein product [Enterobius vermicularis]